MIVSVKHNLFINYY